MKTIGLLGGSGYLSTIKYYEIINSRINEKLGGYHSAKMLIYSFDMDELIRLQDQGKWEEEAELILSKAKLLQDSGADFVAIACNTLHRRAGYIAGKLDIPLLHIADTVADAVRKKGLSRVGLLGTIHTMNDSFYSTRLDIAVPEADDMKIVNDIILRELVHGRINPESRQKIKLVIKRLADQGAEGMILGCTELQILIRENDSKLPLFDSMRIHAEAIADCAI